MPIVPKKEEVKTARINVLIQKQTYDDILLYARMINETEKARIVDELLTYALKRDKDFYEYKKNILQAPMEGDNDGQ